jgi:hypothetical protein
VRCSQAEVTFADVVFVDSHIVFGSSMQAVQDALCRPAADLPGSTCNIGSAARPAPAALVEPLGAQSQAGVTIMAGAVPLAGATAAVEVPPPPVLHDADRHTAFWAVKIGASGCCLPVEIWDWIVDSTPPVTPGHGQQLGQQTGIHVGGTAWMGICMVQSLGRDRNKAETCHLYAPK